MNALDTARDRLTRLARAEHHAYAGDEDRPLRGYLMTMTVYAGVTGALAAAIRRLLPE